MLVDRSGDLSTPLRGLPQRQDLSWRKLRREKLCPLAALQKYAGDRGAALFLLEDAERFYNTLGGDARERLIQNDQLIRGLLSISLCEELNRPETILCVEELKVGERLP